MNVVYRHARPHILFYLRCIFLDGGRFIKSVDRKCDKTEPGTVLQGDDRCHVDTVVGTDLQHHVPTNTRHVHSGYQRM